MAQMVIGGITCDYDPDDCSLPRPRKSMAVVNTYGGVAVFSWGVMLPGTKVNITWTLMSKTLFDELDAVYVADNMVQWDSGIDGKIFNVEIIGFDGTLMGAMPYRENVSMELIVISEVA